MTSNKVKKLFINSKVPQKITMVIFCYWYLILLINCVKYFYATKVNLQCLFYQQIQQTGDIGKRFNLMGTVANSTHKNPV